MEILLPYLVTGDYLQHIPKGPGWTRSLSHGVSAALVFDVSDRPSADPKLGTRLVRGVVAEDLERLHLSLDTAWAKALSNLPAVFRTKIQTTRFQTRSGMPFILAGGHTLTATCCLLPDLHSWASKILGTPDLRLTIPHRSAMVIFPNGTPNQQTELLDQVRSAEQAAIDAGEKPLTWGLFILKPTGITGLA